MNAARSLLPLLLLSCSDDAPVDGANETTSDDVAEEATVVNSIAVASDGHLYVAMQLGPYGQVSAVLRCSGQRRGIASWGELALWSRA